jgi:ribosomal protein L7Ae-like RNA K-turn-binding protein
LVLLSSSDSGSAERAPGRIAVDAAGGAFGRGVHVHPVMDCLEKAARGGIARSLRTEVRVTAQEIVDQLRDAYGKRATGLLVAARRQRKIAIGADASTLALAEARTAAVVVASDAAHAATLAAVQTAVKEGRAVVWLDRKELGALLGRDEVAVCVVTDARIGAELVRTCGIRNSLKPSNGREDSRGEACRSREVR